MATLILLVQSFVAFVMHGRASLKKLDCILPPEKSDLYIGKSEALIFLHCGQKNNGCKNETFERGAAYASHNDGCQSVMRPLKD